MKQQEVVLCYDRSLNPVYIKNNDRLLHTLVVGPTGCGKSSLIFTPLILQDVMNDSVGVTLFDPKEDLVQKIYPYVKKIDPSRVILIDPTDLNCPKINPLEGSEDIVTKTLLTIFSPDFTITSISEKFEIDINRLLIVKSIKLLKKHPQLVNNNLNMLTFYNFLNNTQNETRKKCATLLDLLNCQERDTESQELLNWFLYVYLDNREQTMDRCLYVRGKIEQLINNKYLLNILTPSSTERNLINFDKHLAEGDIVLINTKTTILGVLGKMFGEFLMLDYMTSVFNRYHYSERHGIDRRDVKENFLYIDEFTTFSPVILDLFLQGRSFKIGVHIAIQDREMLKLCGGDNTENKASAIETNCRNIIVFPGVSGETATFYSKTLFKFLPEEIIYRPFGQMIYRIIKDNTIRMPDIGLNFFFDEEPSLDSTKFEYRFEKLPDGTVNIIPALQNYQEEDDYDEELEKYLK